MELKDKVVIIDDKNIDRLLNLYGGIKDVDELSKIINRHLEVAIDEIEEGCRRQRKEKIMIQLDKECPNRSEKDFEES